MQQYMPERMTGYLQIVSTNEKTQAAMEEYLTLHFKPSRTAQEKERYAFLDERLKANERKFAASSERIYGVGIKTSEAVVTTAHKEFVQAQLDARKEAVAKAKADEKAARDKELADKATAKELARLPLNPNLPEWLNPRLHQLPGWFEGNGQLSDGGKEMLKFFEKNPQVMNDVGLMMLDLDKNKSYQDFCRTEVPRFSKRVEEEARQARKEGKALVVICSEAHEGELGQICARKEIAFFAECSKVRDKLNPVDKTACNVKLFLELAGGELGGQATGSLLREEEFPWKMEALKSAAAVAMKHDVIPCEKRGINTDEMGTFGKGTTMDERNKYMTKVICKNLKPGDIGFFTVGESHEQGLFSEFTKENDVRVYCCNLINKSAVDGGDSFTARFSPVKNPVAVVLDRCDNLNLWELAKAATQQNAIIWTNSSGNIQQVSAKLPKDFDSENFGSVLKTWLSPENNWTTSVFR